MSSFRSLPVDAATLLSAGAYRVDRFAELNLQLILMWTAPPLKPVQE